MENVPLMFEISIEVSSTSRIEAPHQAPHQANLAQSEYSRLYRLQT